MLIDTLIEKIEKSGKNITLEFHYDSDKENRELALESEEGATLISEELGIVYIIKNRKGILSSYSSGVVTIDRVLTNSNVEELIESVNNVILVLSKQDILSDRIRFGVYQLKKNEERGLGLNAFKTVLNRIKIDYNVC